MASDTERLLEDFIVPLEHRLRSIATRGKVSRVDAAKQNRIQRLQIIGITGQPRDRIEHAEPYGLAVHPLPGAEAWLIANAGDHSQMIALATGDPRQHPLELKPGEVVIYSTFKQTLHLKDDGSIAVNAPGDISMTGENVTVEARQDLKLRGENVFRHAAVEDRQDVAGRATGVRHDGGQNWTVRTWTDDAVDTPDPHNTMPPEVVEGA